MIKCAFIMLPVSGVPNVKAAGSDDFGVQMAGTGGAMCCAYSKHLVRRTRHGALVPR